MPPPDPLPPTSGPLPPVLPPRPPRPPVPGWMWLLFTGGLVLAGGLFGVLAGAADGGSLHDMAQGFGGGLICGVFCIPVFAGGLALSGRFFNGTGARIGGTLMFAGLLVMGLGAVVFAGCVCLMQGNGNLFR